MIQAGRSGPKEVHFDEHTEDQEEIFSNVGVRIINHPFGNGLYQLYIYGDLDLLLLYPHYSTQSDWL